MEETVEFLIELLFPIEYYICNTLDTPAQMLMNIFNEILITI